MNIGKMAANDDCDISELEAFIQDTSGVVHEDDDTTPNETKTSDNVDDTAADQRVCTRPNCGKQFSTFEEGCNMFASICAPCFAAMKAQRAVEESKHQIN
jgi:hypothetical protein